MDNIMRFESALYGVSERIRRVLRSLPKELKCKAQEIRIRNGLPVTLTVNGDPVFITPDGQASFFITTNLLIAEKQDLDECFKLLCNSSVYAHSEELKNGFIMMRNGHRAGICGTITENGVMKDISSVNIRIAREIFGAANDIMKIYNGEGLLIAGPPGSGKTTVLRDLIRQLSNGNCERFYRISVIDSRGELSGSCDGKSENDLGANSDVLVTSDKASGIEIAVRTMFPDIVAFDEIGTAMELKRVSESFCSGVRVITTAHIGSADDLLKRSVTEGLLKSSTINKVVLLSSKPGKDMKIIPVEELLCGTVN